MCQSKAEGGQRCHSHSLPRVVAAQAAYDASGDHADLDYLIAAQVDLASTSQGSLAIRDQIDVAFAAGDPVKAGILTHVLERGLVLREVNQEIARLYREKIAAATRPELGHTAFAVARDLHEVVTIQNEALDLTDVQAQAWTDAQQRQAAAAAAAAQAAPEPRRSLFRRASRAA